VSDSTLDESLRALSRVPVLLVATDYDGTLAPFVVDPARAFADQDALRALRLLAGLPHTHVAVVSGRALRDLALLTRLPAEVHLVGSHGSEFDVGVGADLTEPQLALLDELIAALRSIAASAPGLRVEVKPASVALHGRGAAPADSERALASATALAESREGVHLKPGKQVVELLVREADKGRALTRLRQQVGATAVVFFGDDATDEHAFATLAGPDRGILVGTEDDLAVSAATQRVSDPSEVGPALARIFELRRDWVLGLGATPIERHSLLSNGRQTALVDPRGRIGWLCHPRPDSPALFADLVGGYPAGFFEITAQNGARPLSQRYLGDTFVLETRWPGLNVVDYLDDAPETRGDTNAPLQLVRTITGHERAHVVFAPRWDFGMTSTAIEPLDDGAGLVVRGTSAEVVLRSPGVQWTIVRDGAHDTASATIEPGDEPVVLELRAGTCDCSPDPRPEPDRRRRVQTLWGDWVASLEVPPVAPDAVRRSALVLKGLFHHPTGGWLAASTTSLPADLGGIRNWDYRYSWVRDGALSARALVRVGSTAEALQFLAWLAAIVERARDADRLMPVYNVEGHELGVEAVLEQLPGYAGSRPVRVGNAALHQVQLDVFGPVAELIAALAERGADLERRHWNLLEMLVGAVGRRWHEPDHGIWEIRMAPRHHVHSKVMCWLTVDRALAVAAATGREQPAAWVALRDQIARDVIDNGWHAGERAFTVAYGVRDLDAAVLHIVLSGLLDPNDSRVAATVHAVESALRDGPTVFRYRYDDGLAGHDAGFHLCTGWLIETYARVGRSDDGHELFKQYLDLAGPTGLLSEGYDPRTGRALGNMPQAYSHLAIVEAAHALANAKR
jgi:trehalose-phosphatase